MHSATLATLPLFGELSQEELDRLAGACEKLEIAEGTTLVREGDFGHAVFAITSGTADVLREGAWSTRSVPATGSARSR
jgi:CRP-like cAMP-binding protein